MTHENTYLGFAVLVGAVSLLAFYFLRVQDAYSPGEKLWTFLFYAPAILMGILIVLAMLKLKPHDPHRDTPAMTFFCLCALVLITWGICIRFIFRRTVKKRHSKQRFPHSEL